MNKINSKQIATYLLLGLGFSMVMSYMYMQYVFYDPMLEVLGCTNAELGLLITIKAVGDLIVAIPGGFIADRFDCKKVLTIFLGITTATCLAFMLFLNYSSALVIWFILAMVMGPWYSGVYKTVRITSSPDTIGKAYGILGIGVAVGSIITNTLGLMLYENIAATTGAEAGLRSVLAVFFAAGLISCVGGYLLLRKMPTYTTKEEDTMKFTPANLLAVAKDPGTWLYIIGCFSIYSFQVSISYFTPYFTAVLGTTVALSGFIAVFRQYGLRIISSPIGGWLGDKLGSTGKVIRGSMVILGIFVLIVLFLPEGTPVAVLIAIVFVLGLLGTMNISLQASISKDCMLPPKHMGIAVGATALFSADLFQQTLFGNWLDTYGDVTGYQYIWIFTLCNILLCITVLTIAIQRRKRKEAALAKNPDLAKTSNDPGISELETEVGLPEKSEASKTTEAVADVVGLDSSATKKEKEVVTRNDLKS